VSSPLNGYAADAEELIPRFEALSTEEVLAPVLDCLPAKPSQILEIGAGTGRDAAWLAKRGHRVVAVEPVRALREAGMKLHPCANISWVEDQLPELTEVRGCGETYDLILSIAVWQHVRAQHHEEAICGLAALLDAQGRLIFSLRHGPGSPTRPWFPADPEEIARTGERAGMRLILHREAASVQQKNRDAGVTWTWLCFERQGNCQD